MRNASPGTGFLGKTRIEFPGRDSSEVSFIVAESDCIGADWLLFGTCGLLWQAIQLKIKVIIRPFINQALLIPDLKFMINIFDLKIIEIR
jgi:hypothetical protein